MATRRNRIKAVINVSRGVRPSASDRDRPLTPITSNTHEPSSPSHPSSGRPHTPLSLRSPSPLLSPKSTGSSSEYPSLVLLKSPGTPEKSQIPQLIPLSPSSPIPLSRDRPRTPSSHPNDLYPFGTVSVTSPNFPFSPGGIQRPSPAASPGHGHGGFKYFSSASGDGHSLPPTPNSPQRPSPAPSPIGGGGNRSLVLFNTNSNSADSHEVARYMSLPSPGFAPGTPEKDGIESQRSLMSTPSSPGAFSSVMRDHANSIVKDSDLLRQRLSKPSPSLSVTKYQTLRKEFLAKGTHTTPERKQLTMLHFAFWNPPQKNKEKDAEQPGSRNRALSVCSDRGGGGNTSRGGFEDSRHSLNDSDSKAGITLRRATVETGPLTPSSVVSVHDKSDNDSDAESTTSSQLSGNIGPRVKVGPDGQLIIDEQSLVVETSESQRAKKQLSEMETISGADFVVGSSGLFRNKRKSKRGHDWTIKETVKFYKALSMCGTDFSMMTTLFPDRTRAELKAKFKREDRKNPGQISLALSCQEFDPDEGITDDEEPPSEDLVIEAPTPIKRKGKGQVLSEMERRLQDELEEARVLFSSHNSNSNPPFTSVFGSVEPVHVQLSSEGIKQTKPVPAGRPPVPWKSNMNLIVGDDSSQKAKVKRRDKRRATVPLEDYDNVDGQNPTVKTLTPPPKKPRKPRVSKVKNEKVEQEKSKTQEPEKDGLDSIDILRFDATDPLGLKVVRVNEKPCQRDKSSEDLTEIPSSTDLVTLTPVKSQDLLVSVDSVDSSSCARRTRSGSSVSMKSTSSDGEDSVNIKDELLDRFKMKKKTVLPPNVKVLPFRVPGGGPLPPKNPTVVDEIEIEISCQ